MRLPISAATLMNADDVNVNWRNNIHMDEEKITLYRSYSWEMYFYFFYGYIFYYAIEWAWHCVIKTKIIHNSLNIRLSLDRTFCLKLDFLMWACSSFMTPLKWDELSWNQYLRFFSGHKSELAKFNGPGACCVESLIKCASSLNSYDRGLYIT